MKPCDHPPSQMTLVEPIEGMGIYYKGTLLSQGGRFRCKKCGAEFLSGGTIAYTKGMMEELLIKGVSET